MLNPDFLKSGQGPRLAFMESASADKLAELLVAFANTDGGMIVIGLKSDGTYEATIERDVLTKALKEAEALCSPVVTTGSWEDVELEKGIVFAIRVPRSIELHALTDGRVLLRDSINNRPLGGQEILKLASAKSTGDYESARAGRDQRRFQQKDAGRVPGETCRAHQTPL